MIQRKRKQAIKHTRQQQQNKNALKTGLPYQSQQDPYIQPLEIATCGH
jgi:hypothetical protein